MLSQSCCMYQGFQIVSVNGHRIDIYGYMLAQITSEHCESPVDMKDLVESYLAGCQDCINKVLSQKIIASEEFQEL